MTLIAIEEYFLTKEIRYERTKCSADDPSQHLNLGITEERLDVWGLACLSIRRGLRQEEGLFRMKFINQVKPAVFGGIV